MLREARHMDLKHLTPPQWELMATCWERNIKVFVSEDYQWTIRLAAMVAYALYYRWKHGRKVLRPINEILRMEQISCQIEKLSTNFWLSLLT
jgi:hypothetical protein